MSKVAKIFVIVNLVLAIIYVGVNASLLAKQEHFKYLYHKEKMTKERMEAEKDAEIKKLNDRVDARTRAIPGVQARIELRGDEDGRPPEG